jgi:hypothetical protein
MAFHDRSSCPMLRDFAERTSGSARSLGSRSILASNSVSDRFKYFSPPSMYARPSTSSKPVKPKRTINRLISAGAIGFFIKSTDCTFTRRSLKNRSAARVACEFLTPNICTIDLSSPTVRLVDELIVSFTLQPRFEIIEHLSNHLSRTLIHPPAKTEAGDGELSGSDRS